MKPDLIENIVVWSIAVLFSIGFWLAIIYSFNYIVSEYFF